MTAETAAECARLGHVLTLAPSMTPAVAAALPTLAAQAEPATLARDLRTLALALETAR